MIVLAVEENGYVYAYDENKRQMLEKQGTLYNYTSDTVSVRYKDNKVIDIYDANGKKLFTYPKDFVDMSNIIGIVL